MQLFKSRFVHLALSVGCVFFIPACSDDDTTASAPVADAGDSPDDDTNGSTDTTGGAGTTETTSCADLTDFADSCTDFNGQAVVTLSGEYTEDITLTSDVLWRLEGGVFIGNDTDVTTLTIEAGTTVYGDTASKAFLTIRRNAMIMAEGTKEAPIVMTSAQEVGSRNRGDWGGLVINGNAPINGCTDDSAVCMAEGEGATGDYGGDDPNDDSGVLRYVRVEFAGHPVTPENELNGIAFQGVGAGTTIEYIQVHMAADDGIEFFGGTASFKYVLTTGISDDNLDWTDGWTGMGQFLVVHQYAGSGDQGIEADNNGENNDLEPRSWPTLKNLTFVGSPESEKSDIGILLREGTGAKIYDSLVVGFEDACFDIDNDATWTQAGDQEAFVLSNVHLACDKSFKTNDEEVKVDSADATCPEGSVEGATPEEDEGEYFCKQQDPADLEAWFLTEGWGNSVIEDIDSVLIDAFNEASPNFVPTADIAAVDGTSDLDAWFTEANFVGGVDPNNDWTQGWTTSVQN